MITCFNIREYFPDIPIGCCWSCHEDADEYGGCLSGDEINWNICCKVSIALEKLHPEISIYEKYEKEKCD